MADNWWGPMGPFAPMRPKRVNTGERKTKLPVESHETRLRQAIGWHELEAKFDAIEKQIAAINEQLKRLAKPDDK